MKITPNFSFACLIGGPRDMDLCGSKETQRWWGRCLGLGREGEDEKGFICVGFTGASEPLGAKWGWGGKSRDVPVR